MRKVVVSTTLTDPEWNNTTVLEGDTVAGITALKQEDGGPIVVGGSHTPGAHAPRERSRRRAAPHGLPGDDRVRPAPFPESTRKVRWSLVENKPFPSGARVDIYHPA